MKSNKTTLYSFVLAPIFIWIGFVCAISFMEAWLKFRAPNVSLSVGLNIGRIIFAALNKVEWCLAALTIFLTYLEKNRLKSPISIFLYIPILILAIQTLFLLPCLNERAEAAVQGETISRSFVHIYYIFLEIVKVVSLFILGINVFYRFSKAS